MKYIHKSFLGRNYQRLCNHAIQTPSASEEQKKPKTSIPPPFRCRPKRHQCIQNGRSTLALCQILYLHAQSRGFFSFTIIFVISILVILVRIFAPFSDWTLRSCTPPNLLICISRLFVFSCKKLISGRDMRSITIRSTWKKMAAYSSLANYLFEA